MASFWGPKNTPDRHTGSWKPLLTGGSLGILRVESSLNHVISSKLNIILSHLKTRHRKTNEKPIHSTSFPGTSFIALWERYGAPVWSEVTFFDCSSEEATTKNGECTVTAGINELEVCLVVFTFINVQSSVWDHLEMSSYKPQSFY